MKQRSILWQTAGFAAATFGGTILHFLYDWTGGSILVSPFSGINESTWEHMKLLFWPLLLFALIQRQFFREQENYWCVKLAEILLGLTLIPVLFYTWGGVYGQSPDWINIAIFHITAALAFLFEQWAFKQNRHCKSPQLISYLFWHCANQVVKFKFVCSVYQLFDPYAEREPGSLRAVS